MGLSKLEKATIEKARAAGTSEMGRSLTDSECAALTLITAKDLGLNSSSPIESPDFYSVWPPQLSVSGIDFQKEIEFLATQERDAVTYFTCLAKLHSSRVKYATILERQPVPTMDQVGPRGLLQYGTTDPATLSAFMIWRKWFFDIDNRAGQETGYLFEPIIAYSIGGAPMAAKKSPIKRHEDSAKGRQVDCIRDKNAYEFKLRITIAASGQGRWREELDFPLDCKQSGYRPVLIVFDPTSNTKLTELSRTFKENGGQVYIGDDAWAHLEAEAGPAMGKFIERYVRGPIDELLSAAPQPDSLPTFQASVSQGRMTFTLGGSSFSFARNASASEGSDEMPDDVDQDLPA